MQAALLANASVNKSEKVANLEAAKKIFENGDRNGAPYSSRANEEWATYDTGTMLLFYGGWLEVVVVVVVIVDVDVVMAVVEWDMLI